MYIITEPKYKGYCVQLSYHVVSHDKFRNYLTDLHVILN